MTIPRSRMKWLISHKYPSFFNPDKNPRLRDAPKVFPLAIKERPKLNVYLGRVVRTEYPRTCVVQVENTEIHPEIHRVYQNKHWIHVHDPEQECYVGDEVMIKPRTLPHGVQYHGKPYQVLKFLSRAEGYTDHYNGKVWTRSDKPSSYRLEDTRTRPAYQAEFLFTDNLKTIKGTRSVLEVEAYGKRAHDVEED